MGNSDHGTSYTHSIESRLIRRGGVGGAQPHPRSPLPLPVHGQSGTGKQQASLYSFPEDGGLHPGSTCRVPRTSLYKGTSPIRKRLPPECPHRALGMVLR